MSRTESATKFPERIRVFLSYVGRIANKTALFMTKTKHLDKTKQHHYCAGK